MITAIAELKAADLFEIAADVYKLLLAIYEKNQQYEILMEAHNDLHQIYANIVECVCNRLFVAHFLFSKIFIFQLSSQRRMLGSYYRVRFFGSAFEELDNTEFIYKAPKITKLVEIKDRLEVNIFFSNT